MSPFAVWKGSEEEILKLKDILERNCRQHDNLACDEQCAHRMLGDQRVMDRLLFARRVLSARLWAEENGQKLLKEVSDP